MPPYLIIIYSLHALIINIFFLHFNLLSSALNLLLLNINSMDITLNTRKGMRKCENKINDEIIF